MGYFTDLLIQKAILKVTKGSDSNGKLLIESEDEIDCRIEYNDSIVIGPQGEEFASSGRIFCEADMKCGDLLGIEGRDFSIIKINPSFSFDGVHVINEVYFQ